MDYNIEKYRFIVNALNPVLFTGQADRAKCYHLLEETNNVLL